MYDSDLQKMVAWLLAKFENYTLAAYAWASEYLLRKGFVCYTFVYLCLTCCFD